MTLTEKKKKAAVIAVAYFIEQEKAAMLEANGSNISWGRSGVEMAMTKRKLMQRRGRSLRSA